MTSPNSKCVKEIISLGIPDNESIEDFEKDMEQLTSDSIKDCGYEMNKKQIIELALESCPILSKIDYEFINIEPSTNVIKMVTKYEKLKAKAQIHFKKCSNQYCNLVYLYNLGKKK
jgi:hypothetical protein